MGNGEEGENVMSHGKPGKRLKRKSKARQNAEGLKHGMKS